MFHKSFKIQDSVAILKEVSEQKLRMELVARIVKLLSEEIYEVEFLDQSGKTVAEYAVQGSDLLLLHYTLVTSSK